MIAEFICFAIALVCFLLVAFRVGSRKVEFLGLGLLFFTIPWIIETWPFG